MDFDLHSLILAAVSTGAVAKIAIMAARTMPPPPAECNFWCRWFYDFVQCAGENQDLVGAKRDKPEGKRDGE